MVQIPSPLLRPAGGVKQRDTQEHTGHPGEVAQIYERRECHVRN
jgi:hypothetical protein